MKFGTSATVLFPPSDSAHDSTQVPHRDRPRREIKKLKQPERWTPENFAREQILGLVRQVFFSSAARPVRQVVLSAVEPETVVRHLCRQIGETLALETSGSVAVIGGSLHSMPDAQNRPEQTADAARCANMPLRRIATAVRGNLWLAPALERNGDPVTAASLHSYLGEIRREFEYSIVEARPVGESNETIAMAQFADGIILVLSAVHTRRATALRAKEVLEAAQARLLGTVLSDRSFPIPEAIYRRL